MGFNVCCAIRKWCHPDVTRLNSFFWNISKTGGKCWGPISGWWQSVNRDILEQPAALRDFYRNL